MHQAVHIQAKADDHIFLALAISSSVIEEGEKMQ